jgi:hypothetical protein
MMSEKIKLIMVKRKINSSELANVLECTPQNVSRLFKKDNWTEDDMHEIVTNNQYYVNNCLLYSSQLLLSGLPNKFVTQFNLKWL